MADCFSLQSIKEIVEDLRAIESYGEMPVSSYEARNYKDAIEALLAENEKLKAERDAAVADLTRNCCICAYQKTATCGGCHIDNDRWEWRGVKEEEDAAD